MGIAKQMMLEEAAREAAEREGKCETCGEPLTPEERDTGRDQCFDCYCADQPK